MFFVTAPREGFPDTKIGVDHQTPENNLKQLCGMPRNISNSSDDVSNL